MSTPKFGKGEEVVWERTGEKGTIRDYAMVETEEHGYILQVSDNERVAKLALESELSKADE